MSSVLKNFKMSKQISNHKQRQAHASNVIRCLQQVKSVSAIAIHLHGTTMIIPMYLGVEGAPKKANKLTKRIVSKLYWKRNGETFREIENMPSGGRVDLVDNCWIFIPTFLVFFALTGAFKYSLVAATFALVNFNVIAHWFAIAPSDEAHVQKFLQNLRVAAHRGAQADAPENTMYAFRQAIAEGADAIELDVEVTRDGIAVLLHDDTVDRTTDGTGQIAAMFAHQAQKLNAAAKFSGPPIAHKFEPIPLLEEALKLCVEHKVRVFIDVKATNQQIIQILLKSFKKYPELYESAAVCSFHPQVVYEVKRNDPHIITGHTWRPGFYTYSDVEMHKPRSQNFFVHNLAKLADSLMEWFLHGWLWKFTGANLLLANNRMISTNYKSAWQRRGVHVIAWTVNDHYEKLHFLHHLKCPIITDSLRDLKGELKVSASGKDGHCVREGGSDKTSSCSTTDDSVPAVGNHE